MSRVSVTWSTARQGNDGYVREEHPDGSTHVFGPMPPHVVPSFVQARRRIVEYAMKVLGANRIEEIPDVDWNPLFH